MLLQLDLKSFRGNIGGTATELAIERMTTGEKLEAQIPVQEWHKQVLDERRRQIESGEAKFVDWETAKAHIRDRVNSARGACGL